MISRFDRSRIEHSVLADSRTIFLDGIYPWARALGRDLPGNVLQEVVGNIRAR